MQFHSSVTDHRLQVSTSESYNFCSLYFNRRACMKDSPQINLTKMQPPSQLNSIWRKRRFFAICYSFSFFTKIWAIVRSSYHPSKMPIFTSPIPNWSFKILLLWKIIAHTILIEHTFYNVHIFCRDYFIYVNISTQEIHYISIIHYVMVLTTLFACGYLGLPVLSDHFFSYSDTCFFLL